MQDYCSGYSLAVDECAAANQHDDALLGIILDAGAHATAKGDKACYPPLSTKTVNWNTVYPLYISEFPMHSMVGLLSHIPIALVDNSGVSPLGAATADISEFIAMATDLLLRS